MYYTYILYSEKLNKYYVGQTQNLEQRLEDHSYGKTRYIKSGRPWELVYFFELPTRRKAMKLEALIKSRGTRRFLEDIGIAVPFVKISE